MATYFHFLDGEPRHAGRGGAALVNAGSFWSLIRWRHYLMPRRRITGLAAAGAVATLALAACGGGSSGSGSGGGGGASGPSGFNAAVTGVVNPANHKTSGTISFGNSSTPDSTDPGNTYYANMWNFSRLYTMPLMTYASCTGDLNIDMAGTGVQAAARAKILSSPSLKAQSDDPVSGFLWYAYLNTKVPR
jgi:hypothetical protein